MFDKLQELERRFEELSEQMANLAVVSDASRYRELAKAYSDIEPVVRAYREWRETVRRRDEARGMAHEEGDEQLREMAREEMAKAEGRLVELERELKLLLVPKDPNDEKNVVLEVRAGTGGDEASLFASEIFCMYNRYAE